MSIVLFILGVVVLAYWGYCMSQPQWNRPLVILKNGGVVFIFGVGLLVVGFVI